MKRMFNLETQEWEVDDTPELDALGYLQSIYRDPAQPESRRLKAAIEALPFEKPKLQATAIFASGQGFAEQLETRRNARAKLEGPNAIEAPTNGGHHRSAEEVSAERMTKSFSSPRRRF